MGGSSRRSLGSSDDDQSDDDLSSDDDDDQSSNEPFDIHIKVGDYFNDYTVKVTKDDKVIGLFHTLKKKILQLNGWRTDHRVAMCADRKTRLFKGDVLLGNWSTLGSYGITSGTTLVLKKDE